MGELPSQQAHSSSRDIASGCGDELGLVQATGAMSLGWTSVLGRIRGELNRMPPQARDACARQLFLRLNYPPPDAHVLRGHDMAAQLLYLLETGFPGLHRGEEEEEDIQWLQSWGPTLEEYIDGMDVHNPWPRTRTASSLPWTASAGDPVKLMQAQSRGKELKSRTSPRTWEATPLTTTTSSPTQLDRSRSPPPLGSTQVDEQNMAVADADATVPWLPPVTLRLPARIDNVGNTQAQPLQPKASPSDNTA